MFKTFCLILLALGLAGAPALAQNRFMDEAKEKASRRTDNATVRAAEHPETARTATTHQPDAEKPAGSQPPAAPTDTQGAPAAPSDAQPAPAQ
jgi:hypothetical protein